MVTKQAEERMRALISWQKHGLEAALDAFTIKEHTLFNWKRKLKEGGGKIDPLNPGSRVSHAKRKRLSR